MRKILFTILVLGIAVAVNAQKTQYETKRNIHYYSESVNNSDTYINERCTLDIYYPKNLKNYPTVVWFHGGGLTGGNKELPIALQDKGLCIVGVSYRLNPKVKAPKYIEDAAAAVSWVFKNIEDFGGDNRLIFISGHSAGGYLTAMVGLDKSWLKKYDIDANRIAGLIPFSGQMITHYTERDERGIPQTQPIIDSLAPLFHVRPDAPPLTLITGDREMELLGRYEENAYMMRMMKVCGHKQTKLYELDGYGHGMTEPAFPLLLFEVKKITEEIKKKQ